MQYISQITLLLFKLEPSHCSTGCLSLSTTNTLPLTQYHTIQPRFCLSYSRHRAVSSLALQRIESTMFLAVMVSNCALSWHFDLSILKSSWNAVFHPEIKKGVYSLCNTMTSKMSLLPGPISIITLASYYGRALAYFPSRLLPLSGGTGETVSYSFFSTA